MLLQMTRPVQAGIRKERHYEVISNHLANANTTGFKRDVLSFDRVFKAQISVDYSQGNVRVTGNTLDLALRGDGFFKVQTPQGVRYTRDGNFMLNVDSHLVTQSGDFVIGRGGGPIFIDPERSHVHINEIGEVEVVNAVGEQEVVDQLEIVDLESREKLTKEALNYFRYEGDAPDEIVPENLVVEQGALELSNVSTVNEMTRLIESHRMYETMQKMIYTLDEIDGKAIDEVGKAI